jgi:hypothetical protein
MPNDESTVVFDFTAKFRFSFLKNWSGLAQKFGKYPLGILIVRFLGP